MLREKLEDVAGEKGCLGYMFSLLPLTRTQISSIKWMDEWINSERLRGEKRDMDMLCRELRQKAEKQNDGDKTTEKKVTGGQRSQQIP